jgi:AcrR family transcriptional regulator
MGRHKSYDRDDVLEKAMNLFWAKGYEGTHLSELVEVTRLNRFGLYNEFGGKEGLFQAALERYIEGSWRHYRASLEKRPLGLHNIRDYFEELSFGDDYHGCFLINTLTEKHIVTNQSFVAARAVARQSERLFLRNLKAAKARDELPADRDVRAIAKLLVTLDQGLAIYGIVNPSDRDKNSITRQIDQLLA